jgi:hypothetical protein
MAILIAVVLRVLVIVFIIRIIISLFKSGSGKPRAANQARPRQKRFETKGKNVADGDFDELPR